MSIFLSIQKNALRLGLFALCGASILGSVYWATIEHIKANEQQALINSLSTVLPDRFYDNELVHSQVTLPPDPVIGQQDVHIGYVGLLDSKPSALIFQAITQDGYNGRIAVLIGMTIEGKLTGVEVLAHKETPGLGDKVERRKSNWLLSFSGKSLTNTKKADWHVKKDGGEFEQFTGATITPRAVIKVIYQALNYYSHNQQQIIDTINNHEKP